MEIARRILGPTLIVACLAGCGGGKSIPRPKRVPLDGLYNARGPQEVGPMFDYEGTRVQIARRQAHVDTLRTYYTVASGDPIGWVDPTTQLLFVEGTGIVMGRTIRQSSGDAYNVYRPGGRVEPLPSFKQVLSVGDPLRDGRVDRALIAREVDGRTRIEIRNRAGAIEHEWDHVLAGDAKQWTHDFGAFYMIFPADAEGRRLTQMIDKDLRPIGAAMPGVQQVHMTVTVGSSGKKAFFAVPVDGETQIYKLLQQDGTFQVPAGVIGMRPVGVSEASEAGTSTGFTGAAWLVLFDTPEGRRWGYADTDFTHVSEPIWSEVRREQGPAMAILHTGQALSQTPNAPRREYVLVQDAVTKQWHALLPQYPLKSPTSQPAATVEQAVASAEDACRAEIAGLRDAEKARLAAVEREKEAARQRRIAGGATPAKDKQWQEANLRTGFGSDPRRETARRLGGVYWVDWVEKNPSYSVADTRSAAVMAEKFDPARAKLLHARASAREALEARIAKSAEESRKQERARWESAQAAAASKGPVGSPPPAQNYYSPAKTYDYRTGTRSDTQQLQDWTYGKQNWKPLSR